MKVKSVPFFGANQFANAPAIAGSTYDENQKATKDS